MQWCSGRPWSGEDLHGEHVMKRFKQRGMTAEGVRSHEDKEERYLTL